MPDTSQTVHPSTAQPPVITLIAAMDRQRAIGYQGQMPWHLPADLRHFQRLTLGKPVVMGRKTFSAIGRPLPKRHNIILTQNPATLASVAPESHADIPHDLTRVTLARTPEEALSAAGTTAEIMIIGGASLYAQFMPQAQRMHLTRIEGEFPADTWFPAWDPEAWQEVECSQHATDAQHRYAMRFVTLERLSL